MGLISRVSSRTYRTPAKMSRQLTKKFLSDEKTSKKKTLEQKKLAKLIKKTALVQQDFDESRRQEQAYAESQTTSKKIKLTNAQRKKKIKIRDELEHHRKLCLEFARNDNYRFKPDKKMIEKEEADKEQSGPLFTEKDFLDFEASYFGGEKKAKGKSGQKEI